MHHRAVDMTGQTQGYLTLTHYVGSNGHKSLWQALCVCGSTKIIAASEFRKMQKRNIETSCGCQLKATQSRKQRTHGMSKHKAFAVWRSMNDRCRLPTHQAWKNYGGRGITVCGEWQHSFQNFWDDMGSTYAEGLTLERKDNSQGYSPDNCIWATPRRQARNTRGNHLVATPWGLVTAAEASERSGIKYTTLLYRLSQGVSGVQLFEPPDCTRKFTIW